jgi:hypothetical protein
MKIIASAIALCHNFTVSTGISKCENGHVVKINLPLSEFSDDLFGTESFFNNHDCSLFDFMLPYVHILRVTDSGCRIRAEAVLLTILRAIAAQHFF